MQRHLIRVAQAVVDRTASGDDHRDILKFATEELSEIRSAAYRDEVAAESIFPFYTGKQIGEASAPDVDWILEGYVAPGCITELDGKAKAAGKTTLTLHLCRAVLDGKAFIGRCTRPTKIVYLTEQSQASFKNALARARLLDTDSFAALHWHDTIGHSWERVVKEAVAECKRRGAELLVIDTLPQFAQQVGDSENNSGDALAALKPLQEAAARDGFAIIIIRHERKGGGEVGQSGRGSTAFAGGVDIVLSVRRDEGKSKATVRHICALSRFDETPDTLWVELTQDGYKALGEVAPTAVQEAEGKILAACPGLKEQALTLEQLRKLCGLSRATAQAAIKSLKLQGFIDQVAKGVKGNPAKYWKLLEEL